MAGKSTILHKQIRVAKFNGNLAKALAAHDLLLDDPAQRQQHRITEKSNQNVYRFRGNLITDETERQTALQYVESLYQNDNEQFDSTAFRKTKHKLKKWIEGEKTTEDERLLFTKLLSQIDKKKGSRLDSEKVLSYLDRAGQKEKISRYNDKKKALQKLCDLHNERTELNIDQTSQLNAASISVLLKIPENNGQVLTGEEQEKLITDYYKTNFPDYEIVLSIIHNDEAVPHVHLTVDGKNNQTKQYDFVQNQYDYIRTKKGLEFPQKNSQLTPEQLQVVGEEIQNDFYEFINSRQQKVTFAKKEYESPEHKAIERKVIKSDTSKRIADREYNTANWLNIQKNKLAEKVSDLHLDNALLEDENESLVKQEKVLKSKVSELIQDALEAAAVYSVEAVKGAYTVMMERIKRLHEIHPKIASEVTQEAIDMQSFDKQKNDIQDGYKKIKRNKFK